MDAPAVVAAPADVAEFDAAGPDDVAPANLDDMINGTDPELADDDPDDVPVDPDVAPGAVDVAAASPADVGVAAGTVEVGVLGAAAPVVWTSI